MSTRRRVAITGLGMVTPVGNDVATTWANLRAGRSGLTSVYWELNQRRAQLSFLQMPSACSPLTPALSMKRWSAGGSPARSAASAARAGEPPALRTSAGFRGSRREVFRRNLSPLRGEGARSAPSDGSKSSPRPIANTQARRPSNYHSRGKTRTTALPAPSAYGATPSPLNGERAGVRGEHGVARNELRCAWTDNRAFRRTAAPLGNPRRSAETPLRGEGLQ